MKPLHFVVGLLVAALFGGQWIASRHVQEFAPPFAVVALRLALTAALILPFAGWPRGERIGRMVFAGCCITAANLGFAYLAVMHIDAPTASTLNQLSVPFTVLFAGLLLGERLGVIGLCGVAVALAGAFLLTGGASVILGNASTLSVIGVIAAISSAASFALGSVLIRRWGPYDPWRFNGVASLAGLAFMLVATALFERQRWPEFLTAPASAWAGILYICIPGGLLAFVLWYWLLARAPANKASVLLLGTPITGVIGGALLLGEVLAPLKLVGAALVIAGGAIVMLAPPAKPAGRCD